MHSLNGSWRPERGRPTKRKARLRLNRENTKGKVEHSNLPSKEQLPVDYIIGKFLLVYGSVCSKLLQNIKCSECGEHELTRRVRSLRITKWAENCTNVFFVPKKRHVSQDFCRWDISVHI